MLTGAGVQELTLEQVRAMSAALGLSMTDDDAGEVTHRLNAMLEALAPLADLPLAEIEPSPVLPESGA